MLIFLVVAGPSKLSWSQPAQPNRTLSLQEALQITRQNALEPRAYHLEQQAFEASARALDSAFDSRITAIWQKSHDDGELNQLAQGEKRREDRLESRYQVLFPTGTSIEVSAGWTKQGLTFPFPVSAIDPVTAPNYLPEHETLVGVAVRQSLWRNWMSSEIKQARRVREGQAIEPTYQSKSQLQDIQGETEHMYWQLVGLNEQVAVAERLFAISKNFAFSMERRRNIGRSDEVDVADADSMVIAREGDLLNLMVQRDQVRERLHVRVYGLDQAQNLQVPTRLPLTPPLPLPAPHAQQALELAQKNRFDIEMLGKQQQLTDEQVSLASEQGLPDIGLFASYQKRGLAENLSGSMWYINRGTVASVGIDFNWTLGNTEKREQTRAAQLRKQSLDYHSQILSRMVAQNLRASYERMRGAERQRQLAETQIKALRNKKAAEERKLLQARSDEVAILRYEIEVLSAEMQRIDAHLRILLAMADIRALVHAYPQATIPSRGKL